MKQIIKVCCLSCGKKYGKKNKQTFGVWLGNCDICKMKQVSVASAAHDFGIGITDKEYELSNSI